MRQTTKTGGEQVHVVIRTLERENVERDEKAAELRLRLRGVEEAARPLNSRLADTTA